MQLWRHGASRRPACRRHVVAVPASPGFGICCVCRLGCVHRHFININEGPSCRFIAKYNFNHPCDINLCFCAAELALHIARDALLRLLLAYDKCPGWGPEPWTPSNTPSSTSGLSTPASAAGGAPVASTSAAAGRPAHRAAAAAPAGAAPGAGPVPGSGADSPPAPSHGPCPKSLALYLMGCRQAHAVRQLTGAETLCDYGHEAADVDAYVGRLGQHMCALISMNKRSEHSSSGGSGTITNGAARGGKPAAATVPSSENVAHAGTASNLNPADVAATVASGLLLLKAVGSGALDSLMGPSVQAGWVVCRESLSALLRLMLQQLASRNLARMACRGTGI